MSEEWVILCVIITLISGLILTTLGYFMYSGLMSEINIRTGSPPIKNITIAYKLKQGPYKECGKLLTESCSIGPKLTCLGVFYDDPKKVSEQQCRSAVGSILSEDDSIPSEELLQLYQKLGYQIFSFPEVTHVVTTSVPLRTPLSVWLLGRRVYPQLHRYIKERKLCAHPFLEIYRQDVIHYMSPLARQGDFYVPEVRQVEMRLSNGNTSEDDRSSNVSDSNSEYSSGSGVLLSDSRESSVASSRESSVPCQDWGPRDPHKDHHKEHRDHKDHHRDQQRDHRNRHSDHHRDPHKDHHRDPHKDHRDHKDHHRDHHKDHRDHYRDHSSTTSSFEVLDTNEVELNPDQDQDHNTKDPGETLH